MPPTATPLIIFTDLDGCLLNKHDYDWSPAATTLETLRQRQIPIVMNSSKTVSEMTKLAGELGFRERTFISENGSVIRWGLDVGGRANEIEVVGAARDRILGVLNSVRKKFRFRTFSDLGLVGVIEETRLSQDEANMAMERQGTEPLLWDDTEEHRSEFARILQGRQLTLTRGGRFWHVAGQSNKGSAMQKVARCLSGSESNTMIAAIGDSPIDQSMLDLADVPIGIPTPAGLGVSIAPQRGIVAVQQGAAGWAEAVTRLLSRIDGSAP